MGRKYGGVLRAGCRKEMDEGRLQMKALIPAVRMRCVPKRNEKFYKNHDISFAINQGIINKWGH